MGQPGTAQKKDRFEDYVPVAERIEQFYERWPEGRIISHIVEHDAERGFILMRAEVYRNADDAQPAATGHAYELKTEGYVQRTSYIEVCETSSVGRALAMAGFEVRRGIASREEMEKGQRQGERPQPAPSQRPAPTSAAPTNNATHAPSESWLVPETVKSEIVDFEADASERTGRAVAELRQFVRDKFSVAGPHECKATELNMYKAWLKSQK
jgi:hypothetical protein